MVIMHGASTTPQNTPTPTEITEALRVLNARAIAPGVWTAVLASGRTIKITDPSAVDPFRTAAAVADYLDAECGGDVTDHAMRVMSVTRDAGIAAGAWMDSESDAATHSPADVADALADVAVTALVAIESLSCDLKSAEALARAAGRALAALPTLAEPREKWLVIDGVGGYVCAEPVADNPDGICGMPVESEPCTVPGHGPGGEHR